MVSLTVTLALYELTHVPDVGLGATHRTTVRLAQSKRLHVTPATAPACRRDAAGGRQSSRRGQPISDRGAAGADQQELGGAHGEGSPLRFCPAAGTPWMGQPIGRTVLYPGPTSEENSVRIHAVCTGTSSCVVKKKQIAVVCIQDVMAECRYLRLPFVMEYESQHFSLDIAWPDQRLGIEVLDVMCMLCDAPWGNLLSRAGAWSATCLTAWLTGGRANTLHGQHAGAVGTHPAEAAAAGGRRLAPDQRALPRMDQPARARCQAGIYVMILEFQKHMADGLQQLYSAAIVLNNAMAAPVACACVTGSDTATPSKCMHHRHTLLTSWRQMAEASPSLGRHMQRSCVPLHSSTWNTKCGRLQHLAGE